MTEIQSWCAFCFAVGAILMLIQIIISAVYEKWTGAPPAPEIGVGPIPIFGLIGVLAFLCAALIMCFGVARAVWGAL